MPGRPKKPVQKENRGGTRPGAGPPLLLAKWGSSPGDMIKAAVKVAKKEGRTLDEVLLAIAYHAENLTHRLAAIKIFKEYTIPKVSEKKVEINEKQAPKIYLPAKKPDPAKVIPIGGKHGKKTA